ncbi:MAG: hypothetical protein QXQ91_02670 [Nanopusillaceae archaeon]
MQIAPEILKAVEELGKRLVSGQYVCVGKQCVRLLAIELPRTNPDGSVREFEYAVHYWFNGYVVRAWFSGSGELESIHIERSAVECGCACGYG